MKKILVTLLLLSTPFAFAKIPSVGIATYKQTINIHASIPESQAAMKAFIPEFQHREVRVSFKDNKLRFESKAIEDDSKASNVRIKIGGNAEETIFDTVTNETTQYGTLMDIDYYVLQKVDEIKEIEKIDIEQTNFVLRYWIELKNKELYDSEIEHVAIKAHYLVASGISLLIFSVCCLAFVTKSPYSSFFLAVFFALLGGSIISQGFHQRKVLVKHIYRIFYVLWQQRKSEQDSNNPVA